MTDKTLETLKAAYKNARNETVYTDVATIPIPVYEALRNALDNAIKRLETQTETVDLLEMKLNDAPRLCKRDKKSALLRMYETGYNQAIEDIIEQNIGKVIK